MRNRNNNRNFHGPGAQERDESIPMDFGWIPMDFGWIPEALGLWAEGGFCT